MSQTKRSLAVVDITEGVPFRAHFEHCHKPGDYLKIGGHVLLVIATVADKDTVFHQHEYIGLNEIRHQHPDPDNLFYAGEEEE